MTSAIRSMSVASSPRPMMLAPIELGMLPQPSDGFEWAQAEPGPVLVCRGLAATVPHFFTTRGWLLGSASRCEAAAGWRQVADAAGVAPERLENVRHVHGSRV